MQLLTGSIPAHGEDGLHNLGVRYSPQFMGGSQREFYERIVSEVTWEWRTVQMFGQTIPIPRGQCWMGDPGKTYSFSGQRFDPVPWSSGVEMIRQAVQEDLGVEFNSCLLSFYRDGKDSVGWHADDEPELGTNPTIAMISLGVKRRFLMKSKDKAKKGVIEYRLAPGSLFVMSGTTQKYWLHSMPKAEGIIEGRISLTFRNIVA